jgi:hypothetical protein
MSCLSDLSEQAGIAYVDKTFTRACGVCMDFM